MTSLKIHDQFYHFNGSKLGQSLLVKVDFKGLTSAVAFADFFTSVMAFTAFFKYPAECDWRLWIQIDKKISFFKRQAVGVWIDPIFEPLKWSNSCNFSMNNSWNFFLVKLTGVTSCLLQFDRNFFCSNNFSSIKCKVSNLKIKIADKRGQLALIS